MFFKLIFNIFVFFKLIIMNKIVKTKAKIFNKVIDFNHVKYFSDELTINQIRNRHYLSGESNSTLDGCVNLDGNFEITCSNKEIEIIRSKTIKLDSKEENFEKNKNIEIQKLQNSFYKFKKAFEKYSEKFVVNYD